MTTTPSTSTHTSLTDWPADAAPQRYIDELFALLGRRFGARLADMWRGQGLDAVRRQWGKDLTDLTPDEWRRGTAATRDRQFVPNVGEFRALCRTRESVDEQLEFVVAQLHRRQLDASDVWPDPALYWAAQRVGRYEMRTLARDALVKRFAAALDAVRKAGNVPPVPAAVPALLAPGQGVTDKATGRAHLAAILRGRPGRTELPLDHERHAMPAGEGRIDKPSGLTSGTPGRAEPSPRRAASRMDIFNGGTGQ